MSHTPSGPPSGKRPSLSSELDDALVDLDDSSVPTVFLVGLSGNTAGKLFKIRSGVSQIGRSSSCFVRFDEKAVSYKHAELRLDSGGCFIRDLDSTNGTFLNDERATEPMLLRAGDVVRIGNNALGFLTDSEDEQQHTRAMARLTAPRLSSPALKDGSRPDLSGGTGVEMITAPGMGQSLSPPQLLTPTLIESGPSALDGALDKLELIFGFAKSYRSLLLGGLLFGLSAGTLLVWLHPPMAVAVFEIYLRQDATPDPNRPSRTAEFSLQGREFFAFAERKFTEVGLIEATLDDLKLAAKRPDAAFLQPNLEFVALNRQGTFQGSFAHENGKFAEKFLAAHLQNFLEEEINKSLSVHASEVDLMRRELESNERELIDVENKMKRFKEKHLHALPEHALSQIQSRATLQVQRDRLAAEVARVSGELNLAKQQFASEDAIVTSKVARSEPYSAALTEVRQKIASAQAQGFAEGHPEIRKLRDEERRLEALKEQAISAQTTEVDRISNPEHKRLRDRIGELTVLLNAHQQELEQVQGRLGEIEHIAGKMPEVEADITKLSRKAAAAKEIHERLHFELKGKELDLQFERASVAARYEIVKAPQATQPSRSSMLIKLGGVGAIAGLMLGVFMGMGHWLLNYARQRKVKVHVPSTSTLARLDDR